MKRKTAGREQIRTSKPIPAEMNDEVSKVESQ